MAGNYFKKLHRDRTRCTNKTLQITMCDREVKHSNEKGTEAQSGRFNNLLKSLSKCKIDFCNEKEECKKIREINAKLDVELKETRELEQSHRYHLLSSREMIGNLQETVSQLVHLKRDLKKMREEIISRESALLNMEKDKENLIQRHNQSMADLRKNNEKQIDELMIINERKSWYFVKYVIETQQIQHETDTQVAQYTCVIEELRSKIKELELENRDKMNIVVLEYEEKIQRGASQVAQLQEQLSRQSNRTDANIDAYKRRLEELEEKLKQSQFKQFLAQSTYGSQYESQVERPYSAQRDYQDTVVTDPVFERSTPKLTQNKASKQNTLQVMYYGNKTPTPKAAEKKGPFNITKKRKLYNEKDYQDF